MFCVRKQLYLLVLSLAVAAVFALSSAAESYKYDPHGKRDPFVPLIGIDTPAVSRLEDITSITDIRLEGIGSMPGGKIAAILNGEIVKKGDKFGDIEIKNITKKRIMIKMGGKDFNIDLAEEGGSKSGL